MYGGKDTNKCKMWHKFNTCMEEVYKVYADDRNEHTIREIFYSMIGKKSK